MDPLSRLDFFARIRGGLGTLGAHVRNPGLLRCAVCGKWAGMLHGAGMHGEPDSGRLCRSCFELLLKNAEQKSPTGGERAQDSLNDFDEHLA
jgi:hypothetical protein